MVIDNPGTAPAHDIELVTKLPKGMQFVSANNMGEYDAGTHSVYWSLAQLPEGEDGSVELVAMPVEPGEQTIEVEGKAQQGLTDEVKQVVTVEGLAARGGVGEPRVYASAEAHSSIEKACMTLGLGRAALVKVPTNDRYEMDARALADAIAQDRAAGRRPIAVVATVAVRTVGAASA